MNRDIRLPLSVDLSILAEFWSKKALFAIFALPKYWL